MKLLVPVFVAAMASAASAQVPAPSPSATQGPPPPASATQGAPQNPAVSAPQTGVLPLPAVVCGQQVPAPASPPPAGSGPIFYGYMLCFEKQGGTPVIDANTYVYY